MKKKLMGISICLMVLFTSCGKDTQSPITPDFSPIIEDAEPTQTPITVHKDYTNFVEYYDYSAITGVHYSIPDCMDMYIEKDANSYLMKIIKNEITCIIYQNKNNIIYLYTDNNNKKYCKIKQYNEDWMPDKIWELIDVKTEFNRTEFKTSGTYDVLSLMMPEIESNKSYGVSFTQYDLKYDWLDGYTYFSTYTQYNDGSIFLKDIPDELNIKSDKYNDSYQIDIDNKCIINIENNEVITIEIIAEYQSDDFDLTDSIENVNIANLYINQDSQKIEQVQYIGTDNIITLYDCNPIIIPTIEANFEEVEEAEMAQIIFTITEAITDNF